jgi:hypothetical protein
MRRNLFHRMTCLLPAALCVALLTCDVAFAQAALDRQEQAAEQPPAPPAENFTYTTNGRRDPFMSLVGTGTAPRPRAARTVGVGSLGVGEISVRGVIQSKGLLVAIIQGPDMRTYLVRDGERLLDGVVKAVTPTGVVMTQEVDDPLSLVKEREVHKPLRTVEDTQ